MVEVEQHAFWIGQQLVTDVMGSLMRNGLIPVARDFEFADQFNMILFAEICSTGRPCVMLWLYIFPGSGKERLPKAGGESDHQMMHRRGGRVPRDSVSLPLSGASAGWYRAVVVASRREGVARPE